MILIQLSNSKKTVDEKMESFLEFCHLKISKISLRECIIALEYFKNGQKLRFFGKIQKGNNNLVRDIRNMAWDLYHISDLERRMSDFNEDYNEKFYLPAFLTFDKRLIEITELYSLNAIAFSKKGELLPAVNIDRLINSISIQNIFGKYFSEEFKVIRRINMGNVDIDQIIKRLEYQIEEISK